MTFTAAFENESGTIPFGPIRSCVRFHVYGGRELPLIILMVFYFKITISIRNKLICNTKQMLI